MAVVASAAYPVRLTARLDTPLSRWLWLVILAIRVLAYAMLMTDVNPPFRLDMPGGVP